jgi:hypothetical protein
MAISLIETASLDTGLVAPTATALTTASGSAPSYSARAWVNFNGTGTVAIRASGNVSSITDNGTGDYTVNFTTAMSDANYSVVGQAHSPSQSNHVFQAPAIAAGNQTTTSVRCAMPLPNTGSNTDAAFVQCAIFR